MKKVVVLVLTMIFVFNFTSVCFADLGDSLGDLINSVTEGLGGEIEEISNDIKDAFTAEDAGIEENSGINISEIIGVIGDSNNRQMLL